MSTPALKVSFYGDGITRSEYNFVVPIDEKIESVFQIRDIASKDIVLDVVSNLQMLVIQAEADIVLTVLMKSTDSVDIGIKANFPFILPTTADFVSKLDKLTVSTLSLSMIDVNVRAYGAPVV